jgi:hypothetical protein
MIYIYIKMKTPKQYLNVHRYHVLKYGPTLGPIKFKTYMERKRHSHEVDKHNTIFKPKEKTQDSKPYAHPHEINRKPKVKLQRKQKQVKKVENNDYVYDITFKKKTRRRNIFIT